MQLYLLLALRIHIQFPVALYELVVLVAVKSSCAHSKHLSTSIAALLASLIYFQGFVATVEDAVGIIKLKAQAGLVGFPAESRFSHSSS